jgi:hypothetical protein
MEQDNATVTLVETPETRVARGVARLNERVPDWRSRVDPDRLDMLNGTLCVVGQVQRSFDPSTDYWHGLEMLGLNPGGSAPHDHGFVTEEFYDGDPVRVQRQETIELAEHWINAINNPE